MMTTEQERWADALAAIKEDGDGVNAYLGGRVASLARWGDIAGVKRWWEIDHVL